MANTWAGRTARRFIRAGPTARRFIRAVLPWAMVSPASLWALVRLGGWEPDVLVQLLAFTPYVAGWTLLATAVALLRHRWAVAALAVATMVVFAGLVLPRTVPDSDRGPQTGIAVQVLTINMLKGRADPRVIVDLVRARDVAVLAVQEITPEGAAALSAAGLGALLPYAKLGAEVGTTGSGLYSRYPFTAGGLRRNGGGFAQAYGTVPVPGGAVIALESAHPAAPYALSVLDDWRNDLSGQPRASTSGPLRILLGDFNATLDHQSLRHVIAGDYRDAADVDGTGLVGTWGPYDGDLIPPVTIDHVLVDQRIGVRDVSVYDVAGSDHRGVLASLTLPAP